jgi:cellulose synthase/poly-beta-1,6-N-acetylglucosamine synthase-like glycosyltransferase
MASVTVQIPLYNEPAVAARVITAAADLRWPADLLEIQVLDDSTDGTVDIVGAAVAALRERGIDAHHIRRPGRTGFKAGALAHGLTLARGDFLLVLDADFVPPPDFLVRTIPRFADEEIGCVQARWAHLNRGASALTEAQSVILDGHFAVEQTARHRAGRFFNFNGTAGVWRRVAIDAAGGWSADTLTEDTDLSYRAQLAGWRLAYLPDVTAAAELPASMPAFQSQQFRWAKGQTQVARKLLARVWHAPLPLAVKAEAALHLTGNVAYLLLLALCLLAPFALAKPRAIDLALAGTTLTCHAAFYVVSQRSLRALLRLPSVMAVCAGLCVSQTRAVIEGLLGRPSDFIRTPKDGSIDPPTSHPSPRSRTRSIPRPRPRHSRHRPVELALALYTAATLIAAIALGRWFAVPFLALFTVGFTWVSRSDSPRSC